MQTNIRFSVVTIVCNGENYIVKTIESIVNQSYTNVEYIVIDGGSIDRTLEIIEQYSNNISQLISEKDEGIYDAMNKGLALCTGDYVIFMNGGDCFVNDNVLSEISQQINCQKSKPDFIYGDTIVNNTKLNEYLKKARSHKFKWYGMFTNHQSMIYNVDIIKEFKFKYDASYKIAADYKFTLQFLQKSKYILYIPIYICNFSLNGISNSQKQLGLIEAENARREVLNYSKFRNISIRQILYLSRFLNEKFTIFYKLIRYKN